jgi:hypothetical protein
MGENKIINMDKNRIKQTIKEILDEIAYIRPKNGNMAEAVTKSTVYKFKGLLSVNTGKRNKEEVLSDIRSLTGITIVSTKPAEGENVTPQTDESILSIKVDPHPYIGKGGFGKEDIKGVIGDIRKIDGVNYFKQIGDVELKGL